jgi:hypothetical protein
MIDMGLRFDLTRLTRICVALLWAMVFAEVIYALDSYGMLRYLQALESGTYADADLDAWANQVDSQAVVVGFGYLALFVLCSAFSSVWIYRASWNARQLQPDAGRITPGWAVGWFFVPILSLWKPYQAMAQSWNSSHNPHGDIKAAMPGFVLVWWLLWVAASIGGNMSFRRSMRAETIEDFRWIATIDLVIAPMSILSAILFIRIIRALAAAQQGRRPGAELQEIFA